MSKLGMPEEQDEGRFVGQLQNRPSGAPSYLPRALLIAAIVLGIGIPAWNLYTAPEEWLYSDETVHTVLKFLTMLGLSLGAALFALAGINRIRESEKGNAEWTGCAELMIGCLLAGGLVVFLSTSPDTYVVLQRVVRDVPKPGMQDAVEDLKFDDKTGEISWKMTGRPMLIAINIDFQNEKPRKSYVLAYASSTKETKGGYRYTHIVDEKYRKNWSKVSVYYAKSVGLSLDSTFENPETPTKPEPETKPVSEPATPAPAVVEPPAAKPKPATVKPPAKKPADRIPFPRAAPTDLPVPKEKPSTPDSKESKR